MVNTPKGTRDSPYYQSFLLRLWRVSGNKQTVWRASLENPATGEQQAFVDLDDLFGFLRRETAELSNVGDDEETMRRRREAQ
jgi:hypothetical protein